MLKQKLQVEFGEPIEKDRIWEQGLKVKEGQQKHVFFSVLNNLEISENITLNRLI